MKPGSNVYVHVWTGEPDKARQRVGELYPEARLELLAHRTLRELGWRGQVAASRSLKGRALVFFCRSLGDLHESQLLPWTGLFHCCNETVLADETGQARVYRRADWLRLLPSFLLSACFDAVVLLVSFLILQLRVRWIEPIPFNQSRNNSLLRLDLAYLYPFPLDKATFGGALTHVGGLLSGLAAHGARCKIFSGRPLDSQAFPLHQVPAKRRFYLFRESFSLSYNLRFCREVAKEVRKTGAVALYQRHGRFVVAGALLSQWFRVPLVLEYNGPEDWIAEHWDPTRFRSLLRLCESCSLAAASLVVVVSEVLREDLLRRGVSPERILVNPNAVDPGIFHPECGGADLRKQLGFRPEDVVVCFLGTFSYWHGIPVLQKAIRELVAEELFGRRQLRFLLVGEGPLHEETCQSCAEHQKSGAVHFAGAIPHARVPLYLDASDILVSPHAPMPDGRPFFGSPTKLFEYMAMGKAIVASDLDQIGQILVHQQTAWLVTPGDPKQLAAAVRSLADQPERRNQLGEAAREAALARHTWSQNVARLLARLNPRSATLESSALNDTCGLG